MPSLSSYDKGKRSFQGRSYAADIAAGGDFQEKMWHAPRKKWRRKKPRRVGIIGNHEHRIEKALDLSPELVDTLTLRDFNYEKFYDDVVEYDGALPGAIEVEGVVFSHYLVSGIMGRPIGGENHAKTLITKQFRSCIVAHSHLTDYAVRTDVTGKRLQGLVAGVYQDYEAKWCGAQAQKLWWAGVVVLRDLERGMFDPQWISLARLKRTYGAKSP